MSDMHLTPADQVVANCVGLLLMPDIYGTAERRGMVLALLHEHLPEASVTHPFMGPVVRAAMRVWSPTAHGQHMIPNLRRAWVALQEWRLGTAVDRIRGVSA